MTASEGLLNMVNDKIYKLYKDGKMYPISLKQITSDKANVDKNNVPGHSCRWQITIFK